ncbi:MAG: pyridoxal-phosphate dependent enzyme [Gammaproteobacteria bacterium]
MQACAEDLRKKGQYPYPIPRGGACALGALGHSLAAQELFAQCGALRLAPDAVVLATGSGGTHAGWLVGTRALGSPWTIESSTVSRPAAEVRMRIAALATEAAALLGLDWTFAPEDAVVHDGYIGAGYGIPSPEAANAIGLLGRTEGVLLDPTYTGKAMAGFLGHLERGRLISYGTVVFVHTGGGTRLFRGGR